MVIMLPQKIDGLADLEAKLSRSNKILNKIGEILAEGGEAGMVQIPKFKFETDLRMKNVLVKLGIKDLFDESQADLSGLYDIPNELYCSEMYHKSYIHVNEEGSEAAVTKGHNFILIKS